MSGPCTGCGRGAAEAKKMLPARAGGAGLFICERCVAECANAIGDAPTRIPGAVRSCSFCTKPEDYVAVMISIGAKMICDECVDHYRAAL